tara:strand:+ start:27641 stop:28486 length:846 start_codon:yes stop_codon:yes gene_type:complete
MNSLPATEIHETLSKNNKDKETENFDDVKEKIEAMTEIESKVEKKEKVPFWGKNPNILFNEKYMFEFYPVDTMYYEQKLNAISRTILILTAVSFLFTKNIRLLVIGIITFIAIYVLHYFHEKEKEKRESKKIVKSLKENFESPALDYLKENNMPIPTDVFDNPDSSNPFGNVMVTDYDYKPNKRPAPPANNKIVQDEILEQAKRAVSEANPDHPDIADKLFNDMGSNLEFEQSLRPFHSNPNTAIPNDQTAFAEFCYGSMISCKEGNKFACARNLSRHTNY